MKIPKGMDSPSPSPLHLVTQIQEHSLDLAKGLRLSAVFVLLSGGVFLLGVFWKFSLWINVFWLGLWLFALFFHWQMKNQIHGLQMELSDLYIYHKEKGHQTCGSMDPQTTRARP